MKPLRVWLVGVGTVGTWLATVLDSQRERLAARYSLNARVQPEFVRHDDPLAGVDGTANAAVFEASPVGKVTIIGPGAGPALAGQGVLSDISAIASRRAGSS